MVEVLFLSGPCERGEMILGHGRQSGGRHGPFWPRVVGGENAVVVQETGGKFNGSIPLSRVALVRHWNLAESGAVR